MKGQKYANESLQSIGYNRVRDLLSSAKSMYALTKAVEQSLQIIKEYKLDEYQQEKLEEYGLRCYNNISNELRQMEYEAGRNKKHI